MNLIKIYLDEDAIYGALVTALRARGVSVLTAVEAELIGKSDEDHLTYAAENGLVLYTFNVCDFYRLHTKWISGGREHAGMILAPQQRFPVGEQLRRIVRLRASASPESMRNRVEFLAHWG